MKNQTQKDKVIRQLKENGCVDNFWAIRNFILRLGAIICDLRKEGWEFDTGFGIERDGKNYIYTLIKEPEPIIRKHIQI